MVRASFLFVLELVLKVLGVTKNKGVKVVPEAVKDPKPARAGQRRRQKEREREG